MGKYASTRAFQSRSSKGLHDAGSTMFGPVKSKSDFQFQSFIYGADPTGLYRGYIQARDSTNYMSDYLNNRGLSWSDIKYPSLTLGYGSYGRLINPLSVSKNIDALYD